MHVCQLRAIPVLAPVLLTLVLAGCNAHPLDTPGDVESHTGPPMHMRNPTTGVRAVTATTASTQVVIDNFTYSPATLTVSVGTKVTWVNHDDVPHTVTSPSKPRILDSPTLDTDEQFSFEFKTAGTYDYFCAVHPKMTGKIIVK